MPSYSAIFAQQQGKNMENFIVSARKYRPQDFTSVVGQQHVTATLENAIKNNHLAQALLFTGPRGVGKTTCARILAKKINADGFEGNPDEDFAFNIFELDAASNNSVDDIRSLTDQVRFAPQAGKYKVYIIDEVHMLSQAAFNAFLKTLEEPPPHAIFILATTEKHKIIPTILSRCQIYDFKRIQVEDIANHLAYVAEQEGITAEPDALHIIAQKADGALRDALSIFDRIVSFSGNSISYQDAILNLNILDYDYYFSVTDSILKGDIQACFLTFNEILEKGFDGHNFINGLSAHFRDLMVSKDPKTINLLEVGQNIKKKYYEQSQQCSIELLFNGLEFLNDCDIHYKGSQNQRLLVELTLLKLCRIQHTSPEGEKKNNEPKQVTEPAPQAKQADTPPVQQAQPKTEEKIQEASPEPTPTPISTAVKQPEAAEPIKPKEEPKPVVAETVEEPKQEEPKQEAPKPTPRPAVSKPTSVSGFSISNFDDDENEENEEDAVEIEDTSNLPQDKFSEVILRGLWKKYSERIKLRGSDNLYSTFSKYQPDLKENNRIEFKVENNIQADYVETEKANLLAFLRKELNNYHINVFPVVIEVAESKSLYLPQDKFKHLAEKNPNLLTLKKNLGLELN